MGLSSLRRHREGPREPVPPRKSTDQLLAEARAKEIELIKEVGQLRLELNTAAPPEALAELAQATERAAELERTNEQLVADKAWLTEQNAQLTADAKRLTDELAEVHELLESLTADPATPEPKPDTAPATPRGRRKRRSPQ